MILHLSRRLSLEANNKHLISVVLLLLPSIAQAATCGRWDNTITDQQTFLRKESGSLAVKVAGRYHSLKKQSCVALGHSSPELRFVLNHKFETTQSAFLTAHVALVSYSPQSNTTYLFRNHKAGQSHWSRDRSSAAYTSIHEIPHRDFNLDLTGSEDNFDSKYQNSAGKYWNDEIRDGGNNYKTWNSRSSFQVDRRFLGDSSGRYAIQTQNYVISFTTKSDDSKSENELDFRVNTGGAECVFLRIGGSENVRSAFAGNYIISLNSA